MQSCGKELFGPHPSRNLTSPDLTPLIMSIESIGNFSPSSGTLQRHGHAHGTVIIRDPADPTRSWDGLFLADTGTMDSLVPVSCIEAIGLEPEGQRVYETADGREIRMDFARAYIEFMGDVTAGRVIIGDEGVEPLLGGHGPGIHGH